MAWPSAFVAGNTLTATQLNGIQAAGVAWTAYTPTTTSITLGNGSVGGRYLQMGKTVFFSATFLFGSTSAVTGGITLSLPVPAIANSANFGSGTGDITDGSAAAVYPCAWIANATSIASVKLLPAAGTSPYVNTGPNLPMVWATGDVLNIRGTYEAS